MLSVFGWKVSGSISEEYAGKNLVVIVAPHTSNWDGIFGLQQSGLDIVLLW